MKRSTGLRIWSAAPVIALAALLAGCGGGGGGGGAPAAPRRSNMNVRVEIPRTALSVVSDAVISVLSYDSAGGATVVAGATATITYDDATGKYKGSFSISEIPAGRYVCTVSVYPEGSTTNSVNLGSLVDITSGVTSNVTITPASTVKALAALYYAHLYGAALSAVSTTVELAISTEVNGLIAATTPLDPVNFINGYYTQGADPFDIANWTTGLETELYGILDGADLLVGAAAGSLSVSGIMEYSTTSVSLGPYTGTISLSGIEVTATPAVTGTSYTATTNAQGDFSFSNIPVGSYQLMVGMLYGPSFTVSLGGNTAITELNLCSGVTAPITPLTLTGVHNYPNPWTSTSGNIVFSAAPESTYTEGGTIQVGVDVYGLAGALEKTVSATHAGTIPSENGAYSLATWDGITSGTNYIGSGVYVYIVTANDGIYETNVNSCMIVTAPEPVCGNNILETGEQCEDGNTTSGDGCSATCQTEATAACSSAALGYVATAKSNLFIPSITATEYNAAKTAVTSALFVSPNCPDANLIGAFVDLIGEADRIGTQVLLNPYTIFPIGLSYDTGTIIGARALAPVVGPIVGGLPRTSQGTISGTSTPSEMQAELETNVLPVLTGALTKLNKVRTAAAADAGWLFSYPKDPAYPELGIEYIDKNDVDLLTGVYQLVLAQVKYLLAYNFDLPVGYVDTDPCKEEICSLWDQYGSCTSWVIDGSFEALAMPNTCEAADTTTPPDGIITPTESFPPSPFGTVRTGGYLSAAKTDMSGGLSLIYTAITNILLEANQDVAGMSMAAGMIADIEQYKHYVSELAASFGGPTSITVPATDECWYLQGGYYYSDSVFDPTYNTADLVGCAAHFTTGPAITASIYLGALYDITNFRNVLTNYTIATGEYDMSGVATIAGIFPNGVQESWFNYEVHVSRFGFYIPLFYAVTGAPIYTASATVVIDGYTINLSMCDGGYTVCKATQWPTSLPASGEYITMNDMYGTAATLTVPGYVPVSLILDGEGYNQSVSLTLTP